MTYFEAKERIANQEQMDICEVEGLIASIYLDLKEFLRTKIDSTNTQYPQKVALKEVQDFMFGTKP